MRKAARCRTIMPPSDLEKCRALHHAGKLKNFEDKPCSNEPALARENLSMNDSDQLVPHIAQLQNIAAPSPNWTCSPALQNAPNDIGLQAPAIQ